MGQDEIISVGLSIVKMPDGRIRIISSLPGLYLSWSEPKALFADLGPVLRKLLVDNQGVEWLRADDEKSI